MKKIIILFVLLFASIHCFAQNTDLKHYYDVVQGFDGWAISMYLEELDKNDIAGYEQEFMDLMHKEISQKLTPIKKLNKNNKWLFQKALNEWDYEKGEAYVIGCTDSKYANSGILIFAIIRGKNDFLWRAYEMTENDLNNIDDLF